MKNYYPSLFLLLLLFVSFVNAQQDDSSSSYLPKNFSTFTLGTKMLEIPNEFKFLRGEKLASGIERNWYSKHVNEKRNLDLERITVENHIIVGLLIRSRKSDMLDYAALLKRKYSKFVISDKPNKIVFEDFEIYIIIEFSNNIGECLFSLKG